MRALFASAILACSLLTAVPAHADSTYAGCDRPTFSKSVKFKNKFAYSIEQPVIGCTEHFDVGGCKMLVSADSLEQFAVIEVGNKVRSSRPWTAGQRVEQPIIPGCADATTGPQPPYVTTKHQAAFLLTWKGKKYIARPSLKVTFNGYNTEGSIVAFKPTGQWDFKRLTKN
ncbi:MAG: hypothetical protein IPG68_06015 [Micrococcales bacterium]|nr:hypothetical protein [Micrococcales bacterium]